MKSRNGARQVAVSAFSLFWAISLFLNVPANAQSAAVNPSEDVAAVTRPQIRTANPAGISAAAVPGGPLAADQVHSTQPRINETQLQANAQVGNPSAPPSSPSSSASSSSNARNSGDATNPSTGSSITYTLPPAPLPQATPTMKFIEPGQSAPDLMIVNKLALGLRSSFSPFAIAGWFAVAGYEQARDSTPNFGTDRGAYGRRLEDAALRDASEDLFSDSVMSSTFREDPRYYRLGPSYHFMHRVLYAVSRTIITRTDSGGTSPNYALITGNLAGAVLTNAYYPSANRSASQTVETFAGSLGGSAFGNFMYEFFGGYIHRIQDPKH
jgi:hypothetical protein